VPGRVVKTFTVSRIVERLAELRGRRVVEVPVGFTYIVDAMLEGDVLIGGEESGGIGVAGHLPERDGVANALLLLEAMAASGMDPGARFAELERETLWRHAYRRVDVRLKGTALKDAVMAALGTPPAAVAGRAVTSTERRDGVKLNLEGDAWLLFRPSGTEPVLRLYCEAPDAEAVDAVLQGARNYVEACA
jgi:phosphomannomutase